jgi:hypothetical protein
MGLAAAESDLCNIYNIHTYLPMKTEQTLCSKRLAFKLQTPVNNPEESIRHSEHGNILKSRFTMLKIKVAIKVKMWIQ